MSRWRQRTVTALLAVSAALTAPPVSAAHAAAHCPRSRERIACVDLTHQRMWVVKNGKVLFGPVEVRTGGPRTPTRTGHWHIYWRDLHHWSSLYNVPMPYSQFFSGGEAFHAVPYPLSSERASHGCINLSFKDARRLWEVLRLHDPVVIWGHKPNGWPPMKIRR